MRFVIVGIIVVRTSQPCRTELGKNPRLSQTVCKVFHRLQRDSLLMEGIDREEDAVHTAVVQHPGHRSYVFFFPAEIAVGYDITLRYPRSPGSAVYRTYCLGPQQRLSSEGHQRLYVITAADLGNGSCCRSTVNVPSSDIMAAFTAMSAPAGAAHRNHKFYSFNVFQVFVHNNCSFNNNLNIIIRRSTGTLLTRRDVPSFTAPSS